MPKTKRKRQVDPEEVLARPWCYYCERDFDDQLVLISHMKQKHFQCRNCRRKLNTAGGLKVHLEQVHKESLDYIENALPNRAAAPPTGPEIFNMEGIPADIMQMHRDRILRQLTEDNVTFRNTGNPPPGTKPDESKKAKIETMEEMKARAAEHKAKRAAERAARARGEVVVNEEPDVAQASQSPAPMDATVAHAVQASPLPPGPSHFAPSTIHNSGTPAQHLMPTRGHEYNHYGGLPGHTSPFNPHGAPSGFNPNNPFPGYGGQVPNSNNAVPGPYGNFDLPHSQGPVVPRPLSGGHGYPLRPSSGHGNAPSMQHGSPGQYSSLFSQASQGYDHPQHQQPHFQQHHTPQHQLPPQYISRDQYDQQHFQGGPNHPPGIPSIPGMSTYPGQAALAAHSPAPGNHNRHTGFGFSAPPGQFPAHGLPPAPPGLPAPLGQSPPPGLPSTPGLSLAPGLPPKPPTSVSPSNGFNGQYAGSAFHVPPSQPTQDPRVAARLERESRRPSQDSVLALKNVPSTDQEVSTGPPSHKYAAEASSMDSKTPNTNGTGAAAENPPAAKKSKKDKKKAENTKILYTRDLSPEELRATANRFREFNIDYSKQKPETVRGPVEASVRAPVGGTNEAMDTEMSG